MIDTFVPRRIMVIALISMQTQTIILQKSSSFIDTTFISI